jgi:hypothetical protein
VRFVVAKYKLRSVVVLLAHHIQQDMPDDRLVEQQDLQLAIHRDYEWRSWLLVRVDVVSMRKK